MLYGKGFIKAGVVSDRPVTVADIAPTFAELLDLDSFPARDGDPLRDALLPEGRRPGVVPKLVVTLVWDGVGDNVLEQWPDDWPNLKRIAAEGTTYERATVGSSPSITPAVHATIGTGAFPATHGLPDTRMRVGGRMVDAWEGTSPRYLKVKTLAELWDEANGNRPLVGMLARDSWHLGMIGHGSYLSDGDRDIAVLDELGGIEFRTNSDYYEMPAYMGGTPGLEAAVNEVDVRDGEADLRWLGNPILPYAASVRYTPAWSIYQTERIIQLLSTEGFGRDEVPDLFFTNYKATDLAGHQWNMVEPEEQENLREQDAQLPRLIEFLDRAVGEDDYVIAITADHGMTPYPEVTRGWSIEMRDMEKDIAEHFDRVTPGTPLVLSNRGYQLFFDREELRRNDAAPEDIARFIRDYRIEDNITPTNTVLPRFRGHTDERLFLTALTPDELRAALACAHSNPE